MKRPVGRPVSVERRQAIKQLRERGWGGRRIAKALNISLGSVYNIEKYVPKNYPQAKVDDKKE